MQPYTTITASIFTRQPLKSLYITLTLLTLPLRLFLAIIYYLPTLTRQHPRWTLRQAVGTAVLRAFFKYSVAVEHREPGTLKPGRLGKCFITISPSTRTPSPYTGIVLTVPDITPLPLGAIWYPSPPTTTPELLAIHLHGGAYIGGSARPPDGSFGPKLLAKHLGCPVLVSEYRLSTEPHSSFPAALQDAISTYSYALHTLGVAPENIVISGDSAGGHLTLSLLRYIAETGALPAPRAALLWSPWVDLTVDPATVDSKAHAGTDYVFGGLVAWGIRQFVPKGWDTGHPYISHLGNGFKTETALFVQTCEEELLLEDNLKFAEEMRECGNEVELLKVADAPHDIFAAGMVLGFAKEASKMVARAAGFVREIGGEGEDGVVVG